MFGHSTLTDSKKISDGKKPGAGLDDTYELNGPISLKLIWSFASN